MIYERFALHTLSAIEMDIGDTLRFVLHNGQARTLTLLHTAASIIETSVTDTHVEEPRGGTTMHFDCDVLLDGEPLTLSRYLCTQESFYTPLVIDGMRLWLDAVRDVFDLICEEHGACKPQKAARFAFEDAQDLPCPEPLHDWCPLADTGIDIGDTYAGDDCWMGPYLGASAHGGLDINHPAGTPLYTPLAIDYQYLFHALAMGDVNNRWRGVRRWANGDLWILQVHHLIRLHAPEMIPLPAGALLADGAGVFVGDHEHSHFVFQVVHDGERLPLDPWILFWQMLEQRRRMPDRLRAILRMPLPAQTGTPVAFAAETEHAAYFWSFGDGCASASRTPVHAYESPGVYSVTLTVRRGDEEDCGTELLTVHGTQTKASTLRVVCTPALYVRKPSACDCFGRRTAQTDTLRFVGCAQSPTPCTQTFTLTGQTGAVRSTLSDPDFPARVVQDGAQWHVTLDFTCLQTPRAQTFLTLCDTQTGAETALRLCAVLRSDIPTANLTLDDQDEDCTFTPYFWVGHRLTRWARARGVGGFYRTNGARSTKGEWAQYTPYVQPGVYEIALHGDSPIDPDSEYPVQLDTPTQTYTLRAHPGVSRILGRFPLAGSCRDTLRIYADGAQGLLYVDALTFTRIE